MVLDVRFLPNPHWVPALRPQTGLVPGRCRPTCSASRTPSPSSTTLLGLVDLITPGYVREGKRHATVAIGCTGGKHRSTAIVEELARRLTSRGRSSHVVHRDLGRE